MLNVMYYIADIVHNLLRVVPPIFLHTVQANYDEEQLKEVGQRCYANLSQIRSDDIHLRTEKGVSLMFLRRAGRARHAVCYLTSTII
jgi:hypothetical protein